jgi:alanine dehydrogenase
LPRHVATLTNNEHEVLVERGSGLLSGASDADYVQAGSRIVASASEVFNGAEMVVEVKEILQSGTLIVDISCDTAGAIETSRPTNWSDPTYVVDGVRHFCVDNIPGAVPVTASAGYGEAILPKVRAVASLGLVAACRASPWLARGLTCANGELLLAEAGQVQQCPFTPVEDWLLRQRPLDHDR